MLFSEALEEYWLERIRNFAKGTISEYKVTFRKFQRFMKEDKEVKEITTKDVRAFLNHLQHEEKLAKKSICNSWVALSSFWTWAEIELNVPHVMRKKIKQPKLSPRRVEPYSKAEVKSLIESAKSFEWETRNGNAATSKRHTALRDVAIILVLVDTGIRANELTNCTVSDYRKSDGRLTIRFGKGSKIRDVYVGRNGRKAVQEYLDSRDIKKGHEPLFATSSNRHADRVGILHMIQRAGKRVGILGANVHKFRHTFAINFLRNGGNLLELQTLLGHERMDTVAIYAKLASIDLQRAHQKASPADNWNL